MAPRPILDNVKMSGHIQRLPGIGLVPGIEISASNTTQRTLKGSRNSCPAMSFPGFPRQPCYCSPRPCQCHACPPNTFLDFRSHLAARLSPMVTNSTITASRQGHERYKRQLKDHIALAQSASPSNLPLLALLMFSSIKAIPVSI
jgi:hypothetical protein